MAMNMTGVMPKARERLCWISERDLLVPRQSDKRLSDKIRGVWLQFETIHNWEAFPGLTLTSVKMEFPQRRKDEKCKITFPQPRMQCMLAKSPIIFRVILFKLSVQSISKNLQDLKYLVHESDQYNEYQVVICVSWHCLCRIEDYNIRVKIMLSKALDLVSYLGTCTLLSYWSFLIQLFI